MWVWICKRHWCFVWHTGSVHTLEIWDTYASWNIQSRNHHATILVYSCCSCCCCCSFISTYSYLNIKSETISLAYPLLHYSRIDLISAKQKSVWQYQNVEHTHTHNHVLRIKKCMQYVLWSDVKSFACFALLLLLCLALLCSPPMIQPL